MKKLVIPENGGKAELIPAGKEQLDPDAEINGISILISGSKIEEIQSIDIYLKERN